jgi:hypothetical protein
MFCACFIKFLLYIFLLFPFSLAWFQVFINLVWRLKCLDCCCSVGYNDGAWAALLSLVGLGLVLAYIYIYIYTYIRWTITADSDWQETDPTSHERGRPAETRQQNSDRINIWSQVPQWARHQYVLTEWLTVSHKVTSASTWFEAFSKGPNREFVSLPPPEDKWIKFPKHCIF